MREADHGGLRWPPTFPQAAHQGHPYPADSRLLESTEISADESALTGDSVPSGKDAELVLSGPKTPLAEQGNMLYRDTYITNGCGKFLVTQVGGDTAFGTIARELPRTAGCVR